MERQVDQPTHVLKTCSTCGRTEAETGFTKTQRIICRECSSAYNREYHLRNREAIHARQRAYREQFPDRIKAAQGRWLGKRKDWSREYSLKITYGLTTEQYQEMLTAQGGVCAICERPPKNGPLHVDHDHSCCDQKTSCGRCVRALLCSGCNRGLAAFRDDPAVMRVAIRYLDTYRDPGIV